MKIGGVNLHAPSVGIGCVLGLGAGVAGSYGLFRLVLLPKLQGNIDEQVDERVNAESSALRSHYNDKLKQALAGVMSGEQGTDGSRDEGTTALGGKSQWQRPPVTDYAGVRPTTSAAPPPEDPRLEGLEVDDGEQHVDAASDEDGAEAEVRNVFDDYPPGNDPKIRRVTRAEFGEVPPGYTTEILSWYAGDGILCDEKDDPIRDPLPLIGTARPGFGYLTEDPHVYLVINEELDLCIEVIYKEMSWADAVMGYGDPARKREAPREG